MIRQNSLLTFILFAFPIFVSASTAKPTEALKIAKSYGLQNFERIDAIRYVFNVQRGTSTLARLWTWEIKTGRVKCKARQMDGSLLDHSYNHLALDQGNPELNRKFDPWFINDQYWLLFPFHLVWDDHMTVTIDDEKPLPLPPGSAKHLVVRYAAAAGVGYTPGDVYELFYNKEGAILQWIFRKGGSAQPALVSTWENEAPVGPIKICLDHRDAKGTFHLWFSDVAVKLSGEDRWIETVPSH